MANKNNSNKYYFSSLRIPFGLMAGTIFGIMFDTRMINMNVPTWIAWIIVAILAIISIAIFTGKAPLFIASYNTANQEEKNKYIINTLSKVTGGGLGVITGITALIVLYNGELPSAISWLVPRGILGTIILMIIIGITICKR